MKAKHLNVNATVISVNDPPTITINDDLSIYNESTLIFDDNLSISVTIVILIIFFLNFQFLVKSMVKISQVLLLRTCLFPDLELQI